MKNTVMKLQSGDGSELMTISLIAAEGKQLRITGTIMGAMPIQAVLTGVEMRKLFALMGPKTMLGALRVLFS